MKSLCLLLFFGWGAGLCAQQEILGDWHGTLDVQGVMQLRIVFHIQSAGEGLSATLDSPDQGAFGLPVAETRYEAPTLTLLMPALQARFEGALAEDHQRIEGTFHQGGLSLPLVLTREALEAPRRPQEPQPPFPYRAEEVRFENAAQGITLAGTLTLPPGSGPHPAVVLVSGSGPQNRDEELMGHKPFLVIADYLTRRGIAVLRYDDRGVGASEGVFAGATSEDLATDVEAALDFLKNRSDLAPDKIGIVGHSEGGLLAPMVAARRKDVAFIVLLAGPGVPGKEVLEKQVRLIELANGTDSLEVERRVAFNRELFEIVCAEPDSATLRRRLAQTLRRQYESLRPEQKARIGDPDSTIQQQLNTFLDPWFRFFLCYDPAPALERVRCPVLALNGEKDLQVEPKQNLGAIRAALERGGNPHHTLKELPGLNHLFQTCQTGSPNEYQQIEETFAPEALEELASWILGVVGG